MIAINKTVLFDIQSILAKMNLSPRQVVAELGCGNFGFFVFPLARAIGNSGKVYAVDIVKSVLDDVAKAAKQNNLPQICPIWSNLEIFQATKIDSSSLDSALLVNVLHQSDKKAEIIREAARLLKRGGKLLVIDWKDSDMPLGPKPDSKIRPQTLASLARRFSLVTTEEFAAGPYHFGLILTKQ